MKNSVKALIMAAIVSLSNIILKGFPATALEWELAGIVVAGSTLLYMGKNWLFPSVSVANNLDLRDILSGLFIGLGNGLVNWAALHTVGEPIVFVDLLKEMGMVAVMYLALKFSASGNDQGNDSNGAASKYKRLFPFVAILFLLQSCNPIIATKNDAQKQAKENAKITGEFMYKTMLNNSDLSLFVSYEPFAGSYESLLAEVEKFTAVDSLRKNAKLLFENDKLLRAGITDRMNYHKSNPLNKGMIKSEWDNVKSLFDAVIRAERTLK